MRRVSIWLGAAIALAAIVWTIGWYLGRGAVADRLVEAEQALEARGWTLSYGAQSVGGFPLSWVLRLEDVALVHREGGYLIRLPWLEGARDPAEAGAAIVRLPETFSARLPVTEQRRAVDPALPPALELAGIGRALALRLAPAAAELRLTGAMIGVVLDQPGVPIRYEIGLEAPDLAAGSAGALRLASSALSFAAAGQPADGPAVDLRLTGTAVAAGGALAWPDEGGLREVVYAGAAGQVALDYEVADLVVDMAVADDPAGMDGRFGVRAGRAAGQGKVAGGLLDLALTSQDVAWSVEGVAGVPPGTVAAESGALAMALPLAPGVEMQPGVLELALDGVIAEERLWQVFDPAGALPRDAANLTLDAAFTLRLLARIDRLPPGMAPPYEIANVSLNTVEARALGAVARASGDIEIVQPVVVPTGEIALEAEGLVALGAALARAGLITPEMEATFGAILEVYATPGDAEDTWRSTLRTGLEGVTMNGVPIQQ